VEQAVSVSPTLTLTAAGARRWDCVVVGAGPAGALAAREVARRGASVLLVDKASFPRYKVCGCCVNSRSLRLLESVELGTLMDRLGAVPLTHVRLGARSAQATVAVPAGAAASREAFDAALVEAAMVEGADFLPETSASLQSATADAAHREVRLRQAGNEIIVECTVVLAANGLGGRLEGPPASNNGAPAAARPWSRGSRVGAGSIADDAPRSYEPQTIYMACGAAGYVGMVRIEDGRLDIAAALDPLEVKAAGGAGALANLIIAGAGFAEVPGLVELPWKGTPHLTRSAPLLAGDRFFTLGDAAGYVEPFTGEGIAWALLSATLVAPLALRAIRQWDPALAAHWRAVYHRRVTHRQTICRISAGLLRRPVLTTVVVGVLSLMPSLAWPLLRVMYRD
jgi:2-polyprenyl-6-methoxyphenol hydroxylase-like FAD-dependent oxidoreductase